MYTHNIKDMSFLAIMHNTVNNKAEIYVSNSIFYHQNIKQEDTVVLHLFNSLSDNVMFVSLHDKYFYKIQDLNPLSLYSLEYVVNIIHFLHNL